MDTLQADIDQLEKENAELKDKLKLMTKKSLLQNMAAAQPMTPTSAAAAAFPPLLPSPFPAQFRIRRFCCKKSTIYKRLCELSKNKNLV